MELIDVAGRVVLRLPLGSPGPGRHQPDLSREGPPAEGIYWLRLSQAGRSVSAKLVVVR